MTTYTGPVPPTPGTNATDAQWQSWWAYQNLLRDLRYEDWRAARAVITDKQHDEKMAAEAGCAAAGQATAKSQQAMADAMRYAIDTPQAAQIEASPTDDQLVQMWMTGLAEAGISGVAALSAAKASLRAFRLLYYPAKA